MVDKVVQSPNKLEDVLTDKQVHIIIKQLLSNEFNWHVVRSEVKPVVAESAGFMGEYFQVTLDVTANRVSESLHLFIKRVPVKNPPKANFIVSNNLCKKESLVYQLIKEIAVPDDPYPWCTRALICNESVLVMLDLRWLGYSPRPYTETLDVPHVLTTVTALARFHAATANYETRRALQSNASWTMSQEYGHFLDEANFKDAPWLHCAAKLTANLLKSFSNKYKNIDNLEEKMTTLFIETSEDLKEYENTFNVLVHKDLWINNIMFRYEKDVPVNALLIDYQNLRYGPPTFDIMMFLYCTTSRTFREQYEQMVFQYYFSIFVKSLNDSTKQRLEHLKYDEREFLQWCQKSRRFGALAAIGIFPYILMDPLVARQTYDNPHTHHELWAVDRTKPVLAHCEENPLFKDRQLEICEEFVERFMEK